MQTAMIKPESDMTLRDAIYKRRSVRSFLPQSLSYETIHALLKAAVQHTLTC